MKSGSVKYSICFAQWETVYSGVGILFCLHREFVGRSSCMNDLPDSEAMMIGSDGRNWGIPRMWS